MNVTAHSTATQLRELRARNLPAESYFRELAKLADLENAAEAVVDAGRGSEYSVVDRVIALRGRIAALEQKVCELEAHK